METPLRHISSVTGTRSSSSASRKFAPLAWVPFMAGLETRLPLYRKAEEWLCRRNAERLLRAWQALHRPNLECGSLLPPYYSAEAHDPRSLASPVRDDMCSAQGAAKRNPGLPAPSNTFPSPARRDDMNPTARYQAE